MKRRRRIVKMVRIVTRRKIRVVDIVYYVVLYYCDICQIVRSKYMYINELVIRCKDRLLTFRSCV